MYCDEIVMSFIEIFIVALSLGVDAFVCATVAGTCTQANRYHLAVKYSLTFGFFQFIMPLIGFIGGLKLLNYIEAFDHWVSFLLLAAVAFNMIKDAHGEDELVSSRQGLVLLLSLGVATSIDALAVGLSLTALDDRIFYISAVIGIVCLIMTAGGIFLGKVLSSFKHLAKFMNYAGAMVLLYIGIQVLIEHQVFA